MLGISISQIGSSLAGIMFILATIQQFCPDIVHNIFSNMLGRLIALFRSDIEINFYEFESSSSYRTSGAYLAVEAYVGDLSMDLTNYASRLKANKADKRSSTKSLIYALEDFEVIKDEFQGVQFSWLAGVLHPQGKISMSYDPWSAEKRYFRLTFHSKYRSLVTKEYLKHVMEEGESILKKRKTRMLYTNNPSSEWEDYKKGIWRKYVFEHPATFDNLAMDPVKKQEIIQDLINFTKAKDYYRKIGKAWKRGYLLYGPPGTGKTTMIACMANLLGYDVYDLELTTIANNSELRNILISTSGKSIILIEDIDCTISATAKRDEKSDDNDDSDYDNAKKGGNNGDKKAKNKNKITLSGLLNVIDGLWSPCSQERIIVFTTNHIDKLDPALIRTGRMDKHIEMSYCTFEAFKIFAKNYLDIDSHPSYDQIEKLLSETNISPSDVAENLMPKSGNEDPERRLQAVIRAIEEKQR